MSDDLSAKILEELAALRRTTEGLEAKQEEVRLSLQSEIRLSAEESRREFGVIAEGLRSEIQQVAEGVIMNGERIDRLQAETTREFGEMRSMYRFSHGDLDRRLRTPRSPTKPGCNAWSRPLLTEHARNDGLRGLPSGKFLFRRGLAAQAEVPCVTVTTGAKSVT